MMQKEDRVGKGIALFMILLVLSLPFYSASALAATVQVTKNSGDKNIDGFIDALGDTWKVEALVTDAATVNTNDIVVQIGNNQFPFNSCSSSTFGVTCSYANPLASGVQESSYPFSIVYTYRDQGNQQRTASANEVISADGSAPRITGLTASQRGSIVNLDFTVADRPAAAAVGLGIIEVLDGDTNEVLQTITEAEDGSSYNYGIDGSFNGQLSATLTGEGVRRIKIKAEDKLGHSVVSGAEEFRTDFVAPDVIADSLEFTDFGDYISSSNGVTTIKLDIIDGSDIAGKVKASSSQAVNLQNAPGTCQRNATVDKLWHCRWNGAEFSSQEEELSISITAEDEFGNTAEETLSTRLQLDATAPVIDFFGTERQFGDESYVKAQVVSAADNQLVLTVYDEGAGIVKEGIRANIGAFSGSRTDAAPDECTEEDEKLRCVWNLGSPVVSGDIARVSLTRFQDRVGNSGGSVEIPLFIDRSKPIVEDIELYGVSGLGENNYIQSGDFLKISLKATEENGVVVLVNLKGIVMDAENRYPENAFTRGLGDGWQVFTPEVCKKLNVTDDILECEVNTDPVRTDGPVTLNLEIKVQDIAGNDADVWKNEPQNKAGGAKGKYTLELLGVATTEQNIWEVVPRSVKTLLTFVDLDVTHLAYARMPVEVKLNSPAPQAELINVRLDGCETADGPDVSRALLYGGLSATGGSSTSLKWVMEFSPFDGKAQFAVTDKEKFEQADVEYTCTLLLFSKIGRNAIADAEEQEVKVIVPFAFSSLGAVDENIGKRVKELKEEALFKYTKIFDTLNKVMQWARFITTIFNTLYTVSKFLDLFSDNLVSYGELVTAGTAGLASPVEAALRGQCLVLQEGQKTALDFMEYFQVPVALISCNPSPKLGWYGQYQQAILDTYNTLSLRGLLQIPAKSLYDNIYTSAFGLCIPGIIYNAQKAREIQCRKILCYGRDVPAGIATLQGCDQLYDLQICEYFAGPLFDVIGMGALTRIVKAVVSSLTSPLGLISAGELLICSTLCFLKPTYPAAITICKVVKGFNYVVDFIDTVAGAVQNAPSVTESRYCAAAEEINIDELATVQETEEPVTEA